MKVLKVKVNDSEKWIGGLYYKRNILFSLLQNPYICDNFEIQVHSSLRNLEYFRPFEHVVKLINNDEATNVRKVRSLIYSVKHFGMYEFPSSDKLYKKLFGIHPIQWIPDFQHNYYPEYFSREECSQRSKLYSRIQTKANPLVLSSVSCKRDFEKFYGKKNEVYVVPFVSYLQPEIKKMSNKVTLDILNKYDLKNHRYACICNQFWRHKNHIIVLDAIRKLSNKNKNFKFVFTGYQKDYRNPEYFETLTRLFEECDIKPYVIILGFIDRIEQIALMKHASFVIQPSLFEGWGTVVEDAKVLNKTILLSDIPVHREQMNSKCKLFDPNNSDELAGLISEEIIIPHVDDITFGLEDMYKRAKEYSKGFEQLLRDQEAKKYE